MFIIYRGSVNVIVDGEHVNVLEKNDVIGENFLFRGGSVANSTCLSQDYCQALKITKERYDKVRKVSI